MVAFWMAIGSIWDGDAPPINRQGQVIVLPIALVWFPASFCTFEFMVPSFLFGAGD